MATLCAQIHASLHEKIIELCRSLASPHTMPAHTVSSGGLLLDVGCWDGVNTLRYARVLGAAHIAGIEVFEEPMAAARRRGIEVAAIDLEKEPFPFNDAQFDVVVCNQVFEHLKQVFRPIDEIWRVLKPGGYLIYSVPNLSSLHSRLMLLAGLQPSSIRVFGPHVRGFTYASTREFLTFHNNFRLVETVGVGFYPFPARPVGDALGNIWKSASVAPIFLMQKNPTVSAKRFRSWSHSILEQNEQTLL
jgi:SAM-dependent methyltransferase